MKLQCLIDTAEALLGHMQSRGLIDTSYIGGYITVLSCEDHFSTAPLLVARIGELTDQDQIQKYNHLSLEKAERLHLYFVMGHYSSWQSRSSDQNRWGGAIRVYNYILSFSGLPELADEALMLAVAVNLEMLTREQADEIADISNNDIFRRLIAT